MRTDFGPKTTGLPTPIVVIGSYDENNRPNAMTAAWPGICASVPPAVMVCIINEFPIVMECRVHSRLQMGSGMVLVGKIINLSVADDYLKTDSKDQPAIDFAKVAPFIYNQADATYHTIGAPLAKAFSEGKKGTD